MKRALDEWMRESGRFGQPAPAALDAAARQARDVLPELAEQLAALPEGLPEVSKLSASADKRLLATEAPSGLMTPKRRRRSKSASLKGLPADWRERMAANMSRPLQLRWLMQCVTGCRSEELKNGVTVTLRSDGLLETLVRGAKTGAYAGQPTRQMLVLAKVAGADCPGDGGHSTTRSAVYYGRGIMSRGDGCVTPTAVRAARAVKLRAAVPQQLKQRKQAKAKARSAALQPLPGRRHRA